MTSYWLGVTTNKVLYRSNEKDCWWCLPFAAEIGDIILFYCPRSESRIRHGIFAEGIVTSKPTQDEEKNFQCKCYGGKNSFWYVTVTIRFRFINKLTAKDMKRDGFLRNSNFVKRNFQMTTFALQETTYKRIKTLIDAKEKTFTVNVGQDI